MSVRILEHLRCLVSHDTSDPLRTLHSEHPILRYAGARLEETGFSVEIEDLGGGCVNLFAARGNPDLLLNCHLDTVGADPQWRRDPFVLGVEKGRVYGLGACDIKGAAACMLSVVEEAEDDVAILFNTDEEGGQGRCVEHFLDSRRLKPKLVVVAEPTGCRAVTRHRGYASGSLAFAGEAGHTSRAGAGRRSAVHDAVRWCARALELADPGGPLEHGRLNIAALEGAAASNVVSSRTVVRFSLRPRPEDDANEMMERLQRVIPESAAADWVERFSAPALLTASDEVPAMLEHLDIDKGPDVDFWTEAALFGRAGLAAIVLGPGDIAQAHQADEFVAVEQLERAAAIYARIVTTGVPEAGHVA